MISSFDRRWERAMAGTGCHDLGSGKLIAAARPSSSRYRRHAEYPSGSASGEGLPMVGGRSRRGSRCPRPSHPPYCIAVTMRRSARISATSITGLSASCSISATWRCGRAGGVPPCRSRAAVRNGWPIAASRPTTWRGRQSWWWSRRLATAFPSPRPSAIPRAAAGTAGTRWLGTGGPRDIGSENRPPLRRSSGTGLRARHDGGDCP